MSRLLGIVSGIMLIVLTSCHGRSPTTHSTVSNADISRPHTVPSASEVFRLRSECARFAEKILSDDAHGSHVSVDQTSHYNPLTNRCYVKLDSRTMSNDDSSPVDFKEALYDGQTGEMLAFTDYKGEDHKSGMIYAMRQKQPGHAEHIDNGFDSVSAYIAGLMNDDGTK